MPLERLQTILRIHPCLHLAIESKTDKLEMRKLSAGTYAAFKTECGGLAWEEFPKLFAGSELATSSAKVINVKLNSQTGNRAFNGEGYYKV